MIPGTTIQPGTPAPDFALPASPSRVVSLAELRGRPVVLIFYPADWSPACGDQLALYNEFLSDFRRIGVTILGISVDGVWSHDAFTAARGLRFPLLADFEPKGAVARRYGVYRDADGTAEWASFVIDAEGTVQWSRIFPPAAEPGADGILAVLEAITADAPTPYGVIS